MIVAPQNRSIIGLALGFAVVLAIIIVTHLAEKGCDSTRCLHRGEAAFPWLGENGNNENKTETR
jgi:hypothetical protein